MKYEMERRSRELVLDQNHSLFGVSSTLQIHFYVARADFYSQKNCGFTQIRLYGFTMLNYENPSEKNILYYTHKLYGKPS